MNLRYFTAGIVLELEPEKCSGCGRCVEVCPHGVFRVNDTTVSDGGACSCQAKSARRHAGIVHRERCMECGACALNCPRGAIRARSGVGCAAAIIIGMLRGTEPTCDCSCDQGVSIDFERDASHRRPGGGCG